MEEYSTDNRRVIGSNPVVPTRRTHSSIKSWAPANVNEQNDSE